MLLTIIGASLSTAGACVLGAGLIVNCIKYKKSNK